jgi:CRP-like cAMP-binding protein
MMPKALVAKLIRVLELSPADLSNLEVLTGTSKQATPGEILVREGQTLEAALLIESGWAFRYRMLTDGRRQITNFIVAGDLCDPNAFTTRRADFSLRSMTDTTYSSIRPDQLLDLVNRSPRIGVAFWWVTAHEESMLRAHLMAVGRLAANERIAYLMWELWTRLEAVGLTRGDCFEFPATQELIADAVGLSVVHTNRTLRRLEREGLIRRTGSSIEIRDAVRLREMAHASGKLHLARVPRATEQWLAQEVRAP